MGVWKAIGSRREDFKNRMLFRVGNGQRVKFWEDR